jgi:hypothetical protein
MAQVMLGIQGIPGTPTQCCPAPSPSCPQHSSSQSENGRVLGNIQEPLQGTQEVNRQLSCCHLLLTTPLVTSRIWV